MIKFSGWLGGDQLYPYDLLPKSEKQEKNIFMIISETPRIPEVYKNLGRAWGAALAFNIIM
ncbi:hypothetical protein HYU96_01630 [Candidatus Daviesbacteria bacterium]|nr:hypothetical protein [Candidatus Daviesbacteria bacterium]